MPGIITSKTRYYSTEKPPLGSTINWGHPLAKGLVACWLMNEGGGNVVRDIAGRANGAIVNAVWNSTAKGKALYFDGTNDYISLGVQDNLMFTAGDYSISFLFNTQDIVNRDGIFEHYWWSSSTSSGGWGIEMNGTTAKRIRAIHWKNGNNQLSNSTDLAINRWYHLCFAYSDSANTGTWYLNRKVDGTGTMYSPGADTGGTMHIGADNGTSFFFTGRLTNAQIWRDRCLRLPEVKALYEAPYQFISPIKSRTYFIPDGVAPPAAVTGIMTPRTNYWGDI